VKNTNLGVPQAGHEVIRRGLRLVLAHLEAGAHVPLELGPLAQGEGGGVGEGAAAGEVVETDFAHFRWLIIREGKRESVCESESERA
jgi:hypothetical protein